MSFFSNLFSPSSSKKTIEQRFPVGTKFGTIEERKADLQRRATSVKTTREPSIFGYTDRSAYYDEKGKFIGRAVVNKNGSGSVTERNERETRYESGENDGKVVSIREIDESHEVRPQVISTQRVTDKNGNGVVDEGEYDNY